MDNFLSITVCFFGSGGFLNRLSVAVGLLNYSESRITLLRYILVMETATATPLPFIASASSGVADLSCGPPGSVHN